MNRKCALYTRVSSLRQANVEEGSLKAQEAKLKSYIKYQNTKSKNKWEINDIYRESGKSGKNLDRPEFQRLLQDIEDNKVNTVIVWKIDRLTRSLKDFTNLWETFQQRKIELISLNENFDTTSAIGRAMLQIVLVFAQLEREQTSERTATTMQYRAEQGLWNGGRTIGYDIDPDKKGTLKIDTEQANLVKKAFRLFLEKGSAGKTQKTLNELGYRMPLYKSRRDKKHGDNFFTKQAIIRMLSNPVYIGKVVWAGKAYKAKHKPIIDKKTFDATQVVLNKNRKTRTNEKAPKQYTYILQGILRCGKCDSMMTPKSGKNGSGQPYHYYQCTKNSHIGKEACNVRYVPAKSIDEFIKKRVLELSTDQIEIDKMISKAKKRSSLSIKELQKDKGTAFSRLEITKSRLNNIITAIENGGEFNTLKSRLKKLEEEQSGLDSKLEELDFEINKIRQEELSADIMKESFKTLKDIIKKAKPEKLKDIFFQIIEVVEWHENPDDKASGHCKICYFEQPNLNFPQNTKSEQRNKALFAQSTTWLPREDSNLRPSD